MFVGNLVKSIVGFGLAAILTAALATQALAAVWASLSPTTGQPGDVIRLTTLEWVSDGPVYLVGTTDYQAEIARFGGQVCGAPEQYNLGRLTRKGSTGTLSFRLPNVPQGDYYVELQVQSQCWRVGASGGGPLVLSVRNHGVVPTPSARVGTAAAHVTQPVVSWDARFRTIVAATVLVGVLVVAIMLLRRHAHS